MALQHSRTPPLLVRFRGARLQSANRSPLRKSKPTSMNLWKEVARLVVFDLVALDEQSMDYCNDAINRLQDRSGTFRLARGDETMVRSPNRRTLTSEKNEMAESKRSASSLWVPETRSGSPWRSSRLTSRLVVGERARRSRTWPVMGWPLSGCSGCLAVLVDESAAGGVSSDRLAGPVGDDFGVVGWALPKTAMRPVRVVVLDVFA